MRRALPLALAFAALAPAGADARPVVTSASCSPCVGGGRVTVAGRGFVTGARLLFAGDTRTLRDDRTAPARILSSGSLRGVVPAGATRGPVAVRVGGRLSNGSRPLALAGVAAVASLRVPTAFAGAGMWVWELSRSASSARALVARARRTGLSVVYVKGADGRSVWGQLTPVLVKTLHAAGIRVCAWQYTYGTRPESEAAAGVASVRASGADCFVIDAEVEYEGHYAAADRYVRALRAGLGTRFPVGVAGWPYADYHPAYPLSVFLGPGGAEASLPQVYWRTIGVPVDTALAHTWASNLPYGRALYPLGQTSGSPPAVELDRFRGLTARWGAPGASWWSWQATLEPSWRELSDPAGLAQGVAPAPRAIGRGAKGDVVVWLQEHLRRTAPRLALTGYFGSPTQSALRAFQRARALPATGVTDPATWAAVDAVRPVVPAWGSKLRALTAHAPASARLRSVRREIPAVGRGR